MKDIRIKSKIFMSECEMFIADKDAFQYKIIKMQVLEVNISHKYVKHFTLVSNKYVINVSKSLEAAS